MTNNFIFQLWHQLRYFWSLFTNSTYVFLTLWSPLCSSLSNQKLATVISGKIQFEEKSLAKDKYHKLGGGPVKSSSPQCAY